MHIGVLNKRGCLVKLLRIIIAINFMIIVDIIFVSKGRQAVNIDTERIFFAIDIEGIAGCRSSHR